MRGVRMRASFAPFILLTGLSVEAATRPYYLGFAAVPRQPVTVETREESFALIAQNGEFALHHVNVGSTDWGLFASGVDVPTTADSPALQSLEVDAYFAGLQGVRLFIVLDPLDGDRSDITANPWGADEFGHSSVRTAYLNLAERVARDYGPAFMGFASEINTYLKEHPEDAADTVSLFAQAREVIRSRSPATVLTATFQYELMSGKVDGTARWSVLEDLAAVVDMTGITTYPSLYFADPDAIDSDYYAQLEARTSKPVVVAESGWPTDGSQPGGSQANQDRFIERFPVLTSDLDLRLWIWWFLHDWAGSEYGDYFKSMGLRGSGGTPKSSWTVWGGIADQPYAPAAAGTGSSGEGGGGGSCFVGKPACGARFLFCLCFLCVAVFMLVRFLRRA